MRDELTLRQVSDPVPEALGRFLEDDSEVMRAAALGAYVALAEEGAGKRARLVAMLLDPDPDLRSDAMEALAPVAEPEDLPAIRRSLEGDPVREVKLAAIAALGRLGDDGDRALLRRLVLDRCEESVAWEDGLGDWEDWLDIQIAAIAALGRLEETAAIDDMLAARDDEFAQTLDIPVFHALAAMGPAGASWLLAIVETEARLPRARAVDTLLRLGPEGLADHRDALLGHADAALRAKAVSLLARDAPVLAEMLGRDPDAGVRRAALDRGGAGLAEIGLRDTDPGVQAAALDLLRSPPEGAFLDALRDNLCVWAERAAPVLMTAAARHLPRLAPDRAEPVLRALIGDEARPLEARVAAVGALKSLCPTADALEPLLASHARQVRLAALVALNEIDGAPASALLARAMTGALLSPEEAVRPSDTQGSGADISMPKGEGATPRIRITDEGEIVETDAVPDETQSTLSAILAPAEPAAEAELAEDTPEETAGKRAKRRAVEGPDDIASSLGDDAIRTCGARPDPAIRTALLTRAIEGDATARALAWRALSERPEMPEPALLDAARGALSEADPALRLSALRVLSRDGLPPELQERALTDDDALIRAEAVAGLPADLALIHLGDPSGTVRGQALSRILEAGDDPLVADAFDALLDARQIDTLGALVAQSAGAKRLALARLGDDRLPPVSCFGVLQALGRTRPGPG